MCIRVCVYMSVDFVRGMRCVFLDSRLPLFLSCDVPKWPVCDITRSAQFFCSLHPFVLRASFSCGGGGTKIGAGVSLQGPLSQSCSKMWFNEEPPPPLDSRVPRASCRCRRRTVWAPRPRRWGRHSPHFLCSSYRCSIFLAGGLLSADAGRRPRKRLHFICSFLTKHTALWVCACRVLGFVCVRVGSA